MTAQESIKITVIGDGTVGKTSCLSVYTIDEFPTGYIPTVFENYCLDLKVPMKKAIGKNKLKIIKMNLADTAGQEDYDRLRPMQYPNTDCIVIIFDLCNSNTFESAKSKWFEEAQKYLPNVPIIYAGNKLDIKKESDFKLRTLSAGSKADSGARLHNYDKKPLPNDFKTIKNELCSSQFLGKDYFEVSAKENIKIKELFNKAGFYGYQYRYGTLAKERNDKTRKSLNKSIDDGHEKENGNETGVIGRRQKLKNFILRR